jgi:hypothetical protein
VRQRQVTRTLKAHSKKWRVAGYYLPSKWSGWSITTKAKEGEISLPEPRNLWRVQIVSQAEPPPSPVGKLMRVPEAPPEAPLSRRAGISVVMDLSDPPLGHIRVVLTAGAAKELHVDLPR